MCSEKFSLNKVIEKTDNSVTVEICVPKESPYFDGHFPQISILPGVAQIEIINTIAKEFLNCNFIITEIKRVKFTNLIMPSFLLTVQVSKTGNSISFKINSSDNEAAYSLGTLITQEDAI